jgi:DNA topoisomerase VI subunit B
MRRSTSIPEAPTEVKFHPSSVDNLLVSQLLQASKASDLASFLVRDLQGMCVWDLMLHSFHVDHLS